METPAEPQLASIITRPPARNARGIARALPPILLLSVSANISLGALSAVGRGERAALLQENDRLQRTAGHLREENDRFHRDAQELTAAELPALRVSNDAERKAVDACLRRPKLAGVLIPAWLPGKEPLTFWPQNTEPVADARGETFLPGSQCALSDPGVFRVTYADPDTYMIRPWTPPDAIASSGACPECAFRFVSARNQFIWHAVFHSCLVAIKTRALAAADIND